MCRLPTCTRTGRPNAQILGRSPCASFLAVIWDISEGPFIQSLPCEVCGAQGRKERAGPFCLTSGVSKHSRSGGLGPLQEASERARPMRPCWAWQKRQGHEQAVGEEEKPLSRKCLGGSFVRNVNAHFLACKSELLTVASVRQKRGEEGSCRVPLSPSSREPFHWRWDLAPCPRPA